MEDLFKYISVSGRAFNMQWAATKTSLFLARKFVNQDKLQDLLPQSSFGVAWNLTAENFSSYLNTCTTPKIFKWRSATANSIFQFINTASIDRTDLTVYALGIVISQHL